MLSYCTAYIEARNQLNTNSNTDHKKPTPKNVQLEEEIESAALPSERIGFKHGLKTSNVTAKDCSPCLQSLLRKQSANFAKKR
jgi:hypothetical protein